MNIPLRPIMVAALLGLALPLCAQSPFPDSTSAAPGDWERTSIAGRMENAERGADALKERSAALEREAAALLAENNRLKEEINSANAFAKVDPNDPELVKVFRQRYNLLLNQHRATTEQLANLQIENRRLAEALKASRNDGAREKARGDAAEQALRSGREASSRLVEEAAHGRTESAKVAVRAQEVEAELAGLREEKRVLEALVRRLDPDRVAKLEQALRERDALLREAAAKLAAPKK